MKVQDLIRMLHEEYLLLKKRKYKIENTPQVSVYEVCGQDEKNILISLINLSSDDLDRIFHIDLPCVEDFVWEFQERDKLTIHQLPHKQRKLE